MCFYLTTAILLDVTENIIRPLLLSVVSSPTSEFNASVNVTVMNITRVLNDDYVNLTSVLSEYFMAVSRAYFVQEINSDGDIMLNLSNSQITCGAQAVFNQIFTNTNAVLQLVDLFQNISTAMRIIKQVSTIHMYNSYSPNTVATLL